MVWDAPPAKEIENVSFDTSFTTSPAADGSVPPVGGSFEWMTGKTLAWMTERIDAASVVLCCMSADYEQNDWCRMEAEYAWSQRKSLVPLVLHKDENGWMPTKGGWLALLLGSSACNYLSDQATSKEFESNMTRVVAMLKRSYPDIFGSLNDLNSPQSLNMDLWLGGLGLLDPKGARKALDKARVDSNVLAMVSSFDMLDFMRVQLLDKAGIKSVGDQVKIAHALGNAEDPRPSSAFASANDRPLANLTVTPPPDANDD